MQTVQEQMNDLEMDMHRMEHSVLSTVFTAAVTFLSIVTPLSFVEAIPLASKTIIRVTIALVAIGTIALFPLLWKPVRKIREIWQGGKNILEGKGELEVSPRVTTVAERMCKWIAAVTLSLSVVMLIVVVSYACWKDLNTRRGLSPIGAEQPFAEKNI